MAKRKRQTTIYNDQKTKTSAARTPLKTRGGHICSGRVNKSCSTCGTRPIIPVTNTVMISHEWGKDRIRITTH
jgi:hypothetical protein